MIVCVKCKIEKSVDCFYERRKECKKCVLEKHKDYYKKNKEKIDKRTKKYRESAKQRMSEYQKKYHESNKDRILERHRKYNEANKESVLKKQRQYYEANKERIAEKHKQYREANKEKNKIREQKRLQNEPLFKFKKNIRSLIKNSFKRGINQFRKSSKTEKILGCDIQFFLLHIQNNFTNGMTFDNHGKWHLDHIIPLATAKTEEDVIKLNHYTNFQPLWREENLSKGFK